MRFRSAAVGGLVALAASTVLAGTALAGVAPSPGTVVASGLDNPRGLAFGPDGSLYVAEAGTGGAGPCVDGPEGPACLGSTGAVTRVKRGVQTRIVDGLPSLAGADGGGAGGPQDVSLVGEGNVQVTLGLGGPPSLTAPGGLFAGTGLGTVIQLRGDDDRGRDDDRDRGRRPSHRSPGYRTVADIAAFEGVANPDGGALDSNPYGLLSLPGVTYVADAGGNSIVAIRRNSRVSTVAALPATPLTVPFPIDMQAVPTAVALGPDGALYVGQLTGFPFPVGGSTVWRIARDGSLSPFATGFTNVVDITFGRDGSLYVVELASAGLLAPGLPLGSVIRVARDGTRTTIASNLPAPGGVAVGPRGRLYVTLCAVCPDAGTVVALGA